MLLKKKQEGLTAISLMAILAGIAFVVLIFLKIMPIYFDAFKVGDVVSSMADERNLGEKTHSDIKTLILKRCDVNMVTDVKKEHITIKQKKNTLYIDVEYEVRRKLFGNLDVIVDFKKSVEASAI